MATRKPGTVAAINRQIDAINAKGRRANPARKRTRAQWASEIARIQSLMKSGDNRAAYDHARWLYDETLDEYSRASGEAAKKVRALMDELNERRYSKNPTRTATLVARKPAAKNPGARNLSAPRKKPRENWPRFVVEEKEGVGPWMPRASFRIIEDAEKLARDIHRAQPTIAVRVIDTKS